VTDATIAHVLDYRRFYETVRHGAVEAGAPDYVPSNHESHASPPRKEMPT
jgi:hypothetical protein